MIADFWGLVVFKVIDKPVKASVTFGSCFSARETRTEKKKKKTRAENPDALASETFFITIFCSFNIGSFPLQDVL